LSSYLDGLAQPHVVGEKSACEKSESLRHGEIWKKKSKREVNSVTSVAHEAVEEKLHAIALKEGREGKRGEMRRWQRR
jgi:hypothetical protein